MDSRIAPPPLKLMWGKVGKGGAAEGISPPVYINPKGFYIIRGGEAFAGRWIGQAA